MLTYYAFRIIGPAVAILPVRVSYFIARVTAYIAYLLAAGRRRSVRNNIEHVLGEEADKARMQRTVQAVFRNTAKNYVDLVRLPRLKLSDLEKTVTIHGLHHFEEALSKGKGVILATVHLGNFELGAQMIGSPSIKPRILVEPLQPAAVFRHVTSLRKSQGLIPLPADLGGLKESVQALRCGEVVVVVCDRDIKGNGLRIEFFGEETTLPSGAVALALRTGAAIIPIFSVRGANGRFNLHFEEPLSLVNAESRQMCVKANLERLIAIIERYIRQYPEQWAVLEPVWQRPRPR
jgi:KDO2-lipid IV(A) lauroyltransferase